MSPDYDRLKVLIVIDHLGLGGAQKQCVELAKRLSKEHYQVTVIAMCDRTFSHKANLIESGIELIELRHRGFFSFRTLKGLIEAFRRIQPDIVHTWLFTSDFYGFMATKWLSASKQVMALRCMIYEISPLRKLIYRLMLPFAAAITINAEAMREGYCNSLGARSSKVTTIKNGIESEVAAQKSLISIREELAFGHDELIVTMVARLAPPKDFTTLLAATSLLQDEGIEFKLLIVGEGELRADITNQIQQYRLQGIAYMLGARTDVRDILDQSDVCVLSTLHEGCSNFLMEAMLAAKACVATAVGGNVELIEEDRSGLLVPAKDRIALKDSLKKLLTDSALRARVGANAKAYIEGAYNFERNVKKHVELYEGLAGRVSADAVRFS